MPVGTVSGETAYHLLISSVAAITQALETMPVGTVSGTRDQSHQPSRGQDHLVNVEIDYKIHTSYV